MYGSFLNLNSFINQKIWAVTHLFFNRLKFWVTTPGNQSDITPTGLKSTTLIKASFLKSKT
jgi:hypothetical protein